jgi:hypothetical protein
VAQLITQEAKMVGFSKRGRHWLLDHLYGFVDDVLARGLHPCTLAGPAVDRPALFGLPQLRGLFDPAKIIRPVQTDLFATSPAEERERALIEQLVAATRLYSSHAAVRELMDFTIRLRAFAPYNAMLLHIQKPGLTYAATALDWKRHFGRTPSAGSRPLLVLRTMGPVDFVFDILDTEGRDVPESAFIFPTLGALSEAHFAGITASVARQGIDLVQLDNGDAQAGWIRRTGETAGGTKRALYQLAFNRNHPPQTRLVTVAHELAHLHLGHLGADKNRAIRDRRHCTLAQQEVEAELVAYLVAGRHGLTPRSESYLATYKGALDEIDLFQVMRAANSVESAMGIAAHQQKANGPAFAEPGA